LSTRGTVGLCAIVVPEVLPANLDQDVARISWTDRRELLPEYVLAYLNSTFGQDHIQRYASGMVQQGLSLQKVREIPVPLLSGLFQAEVKKMVRAALTARRREISDTLRAEEEILNALGMNRWKPPEPLSYTEKASVVAGANRWDSEFYAPAYKALFRLIRDHGEIRLADAVKQPIRRGISPEYVEGGDV